MSCLAADLKQIGGLGTEIGEKGINLSGGQKARISFARTLYAERDIYLLDDPLSAVDAHVGNDLFHKGIKGYIMGSGADSPPSTEGKKRQKTVLLVTHQVQFLHDCDLILIMNADGSMSFCGTHTELKASKIDVDAIKAEVDATAEEMDDSESDDDDNALVRSSRTLSKDRSASRDGSMSLVARSMSMDSQYSDTSDSSKLPRTRSKSKSISRSRKITKGGSEKLEDTNSKLVEAEEREVGLVPLSIYYWFAEKGGLYYVIGVFLAVLLSKFTATAALFYLNVWTDETIDKEEEGSSISYERNLYHLNIFAGTSPLHRFLANRSLAVC